MRTLVTTALEETWPKDGTELLFLGEWCKTHKKKESWKRLNSYTLDYHWDDREKLGRDYRFIQFIYEKILNDLSKNLNEIHSVEHSVRYWRIIVGPWLNYFVGILFDRWETLNAAMIDGEKFRCNVIDRSFGELVPHDMADFNELYIDDDWNELVFAQIIESNFADVGILKKIKVEKKGSYRKPNFKIIDKLKPHLMKYFTYRNNNCVNKNLYVLDGPSRSMSFNIQCRLGQSPKFWQPLKFEFTKPQSFFRDWRVATDETVCSFESLARDMVVKHIPTIYLEGYSHAVSQTKLAELPDLPKLIFTLIGFSSDELFKFWTAEKIELGTPLVIGQHGGHSGSGLFSATEDHELKISDKMLTWGWSSPTSNKTVCIGNFRESSKRVSYDTNGKALIVGFGIPRYSYRMYAIPIARQWLDYFEDQCKFVEDLDFKVRSDLLVRPYGRDYGWSMISRWTERYPHIALDQGGKSIKSMMRNTRIYIATYNATTYLESLLWNVPTIIFWNPLHWELRPSAKEYYDLLESVGIFHTSASSASRKVNEIWDDIDNWWKSDQVQYARKLFCDEFSKPIQSRSAVLTDIFRKINSKTDD